MLFWDPWTYHVHCYDICDLLQIQTLVPECQRNIGHRVKLGIVYEFYKHTIYSSSVQKNYSPRTVSKISSAGYNRNKSIFPLISQNYFINYSILTISHRKGPFTQQAHAPILFLILCVLFGQLFVRSQAATRPKLQKFIVTKEFRTAAQFLPKYISDCLLCNRSL